MANEPIRLAGWRGSGEDFGAEIGALIALDIEQFVASRARPPQVHSSIQRIE
jgi:hypothetical protein